MFDQIVFYGAIIASVIFIIQFAMSFFADLDMDADFDADGGMDTSDFISFKGVLHFLLGFCWTCVIYGTDKPWKIALAVAVGVIFLVSLVFVYKKIYSLAQEKKFQSPKEMIGTEAEINTFYNGMGTIFLTFDGRRSEVNVRCDQNLKSGDIVRITGYENHTFIVEPK